MNRAECGTHGFAQGIASWLTAVVIGLLMLLVGMSPALAAKPNDFNGDTQSDVLWRNTSTGEVYVWLMGGGGVTGSASAGTVGDPNWQIAGTGDLNGDGKTDVVWRNTVTGETYLWTMNGASVSAGAIMTTVADLNWQIAGIGDLDGSGKADIVWRNTSTGDNVVWFMNGSTIASVVYLPAIADQNWQIAAVSDVNGDGKADLVWRNKISGENYFMLMNGGTVLAQGYLPSVADQNWKIAGAGDLDGNGANDIVWRNAVTGEIYAWLMDVIPGGLNIGSKGSLPMVSDLNWQPVGFGDMTADGKADIAWYNTGNGQTYLWTMSGLTVSAGSALPTVADLSWLMFGAKRPAVGTTPSVSPNALTLNIGATGTATVSGTTGTVSVSSSDSAVATASISGNTVTVTGISAGGVNITVHAGNGTATLAVTVNPVPAFNIAPGVGLTINAGSNGIITVYNIIGAATVSSSNNAVAIAAISGSAVTIAGLSAGTATITLTAGNGSATLAVTVVPVSQTSQTISFGTLANHTFGDAPFTVGATASSGLPVSFSSTTTGVCTVSGSTVTIVAAGTCTVAANQAGNASYAAAPQVTQSFAVAQVAQTITFGAAPTLSVGGTGTVTATGGASGNPVTFSSLTTGVCTISGSTVTGVAAGTCTIAANQAGNANYAAAAQVTQNITLGAASQTISFGALANKTFGNAPFVVSATASSGLPVSFSSTTTGVCTVSGSTVTLVAAGACTIAANQAGNAGFAAAAQVTQGFTVAQATQTISFGTAPTVTVGGTGTLNATATSGLAVSFGTSTPTICSVSGSTVTGVAVGTCTITANQAGNANYLAATQVTQNITLGKGAQTITFGAAPSLTFGATGSVSATASSGLAVTYSSLTTGVCTISGSTVTGVTVGTCTIAANQAGNANYNAATQVTQSIPVAQASQSISFGTAPSITAGGTGTVSATATSGLAVAFSSLTTSVCTIAGTTVTGVTAGTCTIAANQAGNANYAAAAQATQNITVASAPLSVSVSPTSVSVQVGAFMPVNISNATGTLSASSASSAIATASISTVTPHTLNVTGVAAGSTTVTVTAGNGTKQVPVTVIAAQAVDSGIGQKINSTTYQIVAANDFGMVSADQDFQIFAMSPPMNTVNVQVIAKGVNSSTGTVIRDNTTVDVYYAATSSATDPAAANSVNTTGFNSSTVFKTNFWQQSGSQTLGSSAFRTLYPAWTAGSLACAAPPCASLLDASSPLSPDVGLPMLDLNSLYPATGTGSVVKTQQTGTSVQVLSPYKANAFKTNTPQLVKKYDANVQFFKNATVFGTLGGSMTGFKRFSAEAIPMTGTDDAGRFNPYPLLRVAAVTKGTSPLTATNVLATLDVVTPTSSEMDCKVCHAMKVDQPAGWTGAPFTGYASDNVEASYTYGDGTPMSFAVTTDPDVPGPDKVQNASKLNILRLHDAKNGWAYTDADGTPNTCDGPIAADGVSPNLSCLSVRRNVVCSQCHYSAKLDFAQVGPIDEPNAGPLGRQQTLHSTLSRNMHAIHGSKSVPGSNPAVYMFTEVAPPPAGGRTAAQITTAQAAVDTSCFLCHPGKKTQHDRGVMITAGVVCQDCHGNMRQIGNDFSAATAGVPDLTKRVPWLNEPQCDSCHIGDVVTVVGGGNTGVTNPPASAANLGLTGLMASNGLTALQAYSAAAGAQSVLVNTSVPASRFSVKTTIGVPTGQTNATNLFRESRGHGGVMCQGCHGSTHAEWPTGNANANDNLAATQMQGHSGLIMECSACHTGTMARNLNGPHGMHTVNDSSFWNGGHSSLVSSAGKNACRACHGATGLGTPLSAVSANRTFGSRSVTKGTPIACNLCHGQQL